MAEKIVEINIAELIEGDVLAEDVFNFNGSILAKKNTRLSCLIIEGLRKNYNGNLYVYREVKDDENIENINIQELLVIEADKIMESYVLKYLKKISDKTDIKNIILELLKKDKIIDLMILLRGLGENIFRHSISVAVYSVALGKELHFSNRRLDILGTAALLHDIGMIRIDKKLLMKEYTLTEKEKQDIHCHSKYGFEILQEKNTFSMEICDIVLQHHERYDGTGYPKGIQNEKIHIMAKIIGLCDVYDALTSDRPYRKRFDRSETIEYLLGTGKYFFNDEIIEALVNAIIIYPYGLWIELNNKETGVVIQDESKFVIRPKVMIIFDGKGNKLDIPKILDLSSKENVNISINKLI